MDWRLSAGWQLEVNKYRFLSFGFLYKSDTILPSLISHDVSRYCNDFMFGHEQVGWCSEATLGVLCYIVNFIVGCIKLISFKNMYRFSIVPKNTKKIHIQTFSCGSLVFLRSTCIYLLFHNVLNEYFLQWNYLQMGVQALNPCWCQIAADITCH